MPDAEQTGPGGVAVDFGGTKISAARVTGGKIGQIAKSQTNGGAGVPDQIEAICALLDQLSLTPEDRVGVAVAGRVNRNGEWFALNVETFSKVVAVPLRALLSDRLSRTVTVENDAAAAAMGEYLAGAGKSVQSMGFITVSTGVGGGIVLDGNLVRSDTGLAGHVGFTTSRLGRDRCGSGRMKTIESIASGRALAAYAAKAGHGGMDGKAIYEAHLNGTEWASDLVRQSAEAVAELCANLKSVLDLDLIVLGGSIGMAEGYIEQVSAALKKEPAIFRPNLARPQLGANSALIGILAVA